MSKLLDAVPWWAWAVAVVLAVAAAVVGWVVAGRAQVDAAQARRELAEVRAAAAASAASAVNRARKTEGALARQQGVVVDELQRQVASTGGRAADLERRLREQAAAARRAGGGCVPSGASAPGVSDQPPAAGLPDLARADLVRLAASANETADTLRACQRLLRDAWRATNE